MDMTTETGGLLARFWPKKAPVERPTISSISETGKPQAGTGKVRGNSRAQKGGKKVSQKVAEKPAPTIDDLRRLLGAVDRTLCISEIAEGLGVSLVAASRVVSVAERRGHVTKQRAGKYVMVKLVPISQMRFSQLA